MNKFTEYIFEGIEIPEEDVIECGFEEFCFECYYALGYLFRPKRVLEIGTRRGYSLIALCKGCKEIEFVLSCDSENYIEGSQKIAFENLRQSGYNGICEFMSVSSHSREFADRLERSKEKFDVINVDGDHDSPGVLSDLELCLPYLSDKGIIIVDDIVYILDVKKAVDEFVKKYDLSKIFIDSYRGTVILQRR